ncbi:hypothetical protein PGT21_036158 [Puccinia graminis f. sp. tritici]|uniref:Uncharacterized protein n=1 Tax=Puccinia graminis f. sp. tritici TaxID=56615 RepID=A0A5B0Q0J5_PUCGR|nr:hypothetical protein PGT21_036158 [Puccinia graminis f. sp. tritici]KAA1126245.1 hypothetical protein PGTUg99_019458 [Puccinia graminis f. sp. tritici]
MFLTKLLVAFHMIHCYSVSAHPALVSRGLSKRSFEGNPSHISHPEIETAGKIQLQSVIYPSDPLCHMGRQEPEVGGSSGTATQRKGKDHSSIIQSSSNLSISHTEKDKEDVEGFTQKLVGKNQQENSHFLSNMLSHMGIGNKKVKDCNASQDAEEEEIPSEAEMGKLQSLNHSIAQLDYKKIELPCRIYPTGNGELKVPEKYTEIVIAKESPVHKLFEYYEKKFFENEMKYDPKLFNIHNFLLTPFYSLDVQDTQRQLLSKNVIEGKKDFTTENLIGSQVLTSLI